MIQKGPKELFESVDEILVSPFKWKLLSSTFLWDCFKIMLYKVVLTFESMDIKKQTDSWKCSFILLSLISPPNPTIFNWYKILVFWHYHFSTVYWLGLNTYWILLTTVSNCILEFCPSWISQPRNNRVWCSTICQAFLITTKLKKQWKWKKKFQKC